LAEAERGHVGAHDAVCAPETWLADAGSMSAPVAEPKAMDDAVSWMLRTGADWDRRLGRLRRRVED
jgi:hypothetical protein